MQLITSGILLVIGFVLLIKGAEFLVDGASAIAKRLNVSEIVIGLTIVAFGTSTPELVVNVASAIKGTAAISFGNIIGSNIINILLILGIAGLIFPIQTEKNTIWREIPFSLLAAIVLLILCNDLLLSQTSNFLSPGDGLILLVFFIIFIVYTFGIPKIESRDEPEVKSLSISKSVTFISAGLAALLIGGQLVVTNAIELASNLGLSEKLIGLTIVAIGTSLPELFTSAIAAYKRKPDIAIGNIVGSNIFNIFFILGITASISPLPFDTVLNIDILFLIFISFILFFTMFTGKKRTLDRWEAIVLLFLYAGYTAYLIIRG
jgi:cation:H+ antiporter